MNRSVSKLWTCSFTSKLDTNHIYIYISLFFQHIQTSSSFVLHSSLIVHVTQCGRSLCCCSRGQALRKIDKASRKNKREGGKKSLALTFHRSTAQRHLPKQDKCVWTSVFWSSHICSQQHLQAAASTIQTSHPAGSWTQKRRLQNLLWGFTIECSYHISPLRVWPAVEPVGPCLFRCMSSLCSVRLFSLTGCSLRLGPSLRPFNEGTQGDLQITELQDRWAGCLCCTPFHFHHL